MAGKWPPPPDYDAEKLKVNETTYGDLCHRVNLLQERRRATKKAWPMCTHTHIPQPPLPRICTKDPPLAPMTRNISPGPIHASIDDASRYDLYQLAMDRYDRFQASKPQYPKACTAPAGRRGSNWSNFTEGRTATGGFYVFVNGNRCRKAEEEKRRSVCDCCFAKQRQPVYATNRTSRMSTERSRQDPVDAYCNMLLDPDRCCTKDYAAAANCVYDAPPEYGSRGFYQHRPFRGTVGIPTYNKVMKAYYAVNQHESRVPHPVTI